MSRNRFTNAAHSVDQENNCSPISGYEDLTCLTLDEAVEKITPLVADAAKYLLDAKENCNKDSTLLTLDESAAIYLYSMSTSFFSSLNVALRNRNRHALKSWFAFLKLFMTALKKLPSIKATVWRGVNYDDTLTFVDKDVHIWWGVNSCSMSPKNVEPFLGETGTLFAIDAINGKDISAFSAVPDEQEVILMPGTCVRAKFESLDVTDHLFLVHLVEINPQR